MKRFIFCLSVLSLSACSTETPVTQTEQAPSDVLQETDTELPKTPALAEDSETLTELAVLVDEMKEWDSYQLDFTSHLTYELEPDFNHSTTSFTQFIREPRQIHHRSTTDTPSYYEIYTTQNEGSYLTHDSSNSSWSFAPETLPEELFEKNELEIQFAKTVLEHHSSYVTAEDFGETEAHHFILEQEDFPHLYGLFKFYFDYIPSEITLTEYMNHVDYTNTEDAYYTFSNVSVTILLTQNEITGIQAAFDFTDSSQDKGTMLFETNYSQINELSTIEVPEDVKAAASAIE